MRENSRVEQLLGKARRRIRTRHLIRGAVSGLWIGGIGAVLVAWLSRVWWPLPTVSPWVVSAVLGGVIVIGGIVLGAVRRILSERELAMLVDQSLGTDEVLVTALYMKESGRDVIQPTIMADLERRVEEIASVREGIGVHAPRRSTWLIAVLAAFVIGLLIPQRPGAVSGAGQQDKTDLQEEGDRLQDRLEELSDNFEQPLPETIEEKVDELVEELQENKLTGEQAAEKIDEVQELLSDFEQEMSDATAGLQDLESAAEQLANSELGQDLSEALDEANMDAAADAVEEMMEQLEGASQQEVQDLAEALEKAGSDLSQSSDPQLQEAGKQGLRTAYRRRNRC